MNIGIIGDGQLGKMLALEGIKLGHTFGFLGHEHSPSSQVGQIFNSIEELVTFADVITYESENVDSNTLVSLGKEVYPPISLLRYAQNRQLEKSLFAELDIPHAEYCIHTPEVTSLAELLESSTLPVIIKTTTQGYDGKGQFFVKDSAQIAQAVSCMEHGELIIEQVVPFDYEISIVACSSARDFVCYSITKNIHTNGILSTSEVEHNSHLFEQARTYAKLICTKFDYIGVLTIEFFVVGDILYANELAPRVHNSGHWTLDGAHTSQFENHIRAITHMPLGSTATVYDSIIMHNIISTHPKSDAILQDRNTALYIYGKEERAHRKLGHYTICK